LITSYNGSVLDGTTIQSLRGFTNLVTGPAERLPKTRKLEDLTQTTLDRGG
jgi:hypothetical protein